MDINCRDRGPAQVQIDSYNAFLRDIGLLLEDYGKIDFTVMPRFYEEEGIFAKEQWVFEFTGHIQYERPSSPTATASRNP